MRLETFPTAGEFFDTTGETLLAREAENSLLLGVTLRVLGGHSYGDEAPYFACVEDGDRVLLMAARTPPHNLLLCGEPAGREALPLIAQDLSKRCLGLPGAHGRVEIASEFAEAWSAETGARGRVSMQQRLYRLDRVSPPAGVHGRARWATRDDLDLLVLWAEAFLSEAVPGDPNSNARAMAERAITARSLLVWEDGDPVSMCARSRPTPHGESISLVYTPPALRGRGYASACVAELSQRILDSDKSFCTLFTDLANPTSNAIYRRIGYQPLCDFQEIQF